ncbi:hypothetical protein [Nocardioides sp. LS1]|uniref:hypothetical protein n=1 Tax=Nocardioides sp. LS1 TaxID=1027620 RepID=UPI000F62650F|nr:hypothetical protein [Nocardioides sp. LS1]GCD90611.1 hypothetical protein NLS1_26170 [Nocardioides sp. LS1]
MPQRTVLAGVGVLVLALVAGGFLWWRASSGTDFEGAVHMAPPDAERLSWTDWAAVRTELGASLSADSSVHDMDAFLNKAYERDLSPSSALLESADVLQQKFGFSPASVQWELFSQSKQGAVVMLRMPDSTDFGSLEAHLTSLGFTRPSDDKGVWQGGGSLLPSIAAGLTPELQYVALDEADHLVLTSDTADYLHTTIGHLDDGGPEGLADVTDASGEPLAASVYTGDYTCSALAMSQADPSDQQEAESLVTQAGKVNPISAFAMSVQPSGHVLVVMGFESDDQAKTNADSRAALASGPAPGQGGDFADRFKLGKVAADGSLVTMDLTPVKGAYVLSDLSSGPLLFATC